jgi:hypothetical protein
MKNTPTITKKVLYNMRYGSERCDFVIVKTGDNKKFIHFEEENLRFFKEELQALLNLL